MLVRVQSGAQEKIDKVQKLGPSSNNEPWVLVHREFKSTGLPGVVFGFDFANQGYRRSRSLAVELKQAKNINANSKNASAYALAA